MRRLVTGLDVLLFSLLFPLAALAAMHWAILVHLPRLCLSRRYRTDYLESFPADGTKFGSQE